jgi:hypothetical protein
VTHFNEAEVNLEARWATLGQACEIVISTNQQCSALWLEQEEHRNLQETNMMIHD